MNEKNTSIVVLSGFLLLDVWYFLTTIKISGTRELMAIGPHNLPFLLSIIFAILCIVKLVQTIVHTTDKKIFPNLVNIGITILLISLFFVSWEYIGLFYGNTIIFLMAVLTLFRRNLGWNVKVLLGNLIGSAAITLSIYLIFGVLMGVRF